MKTKLLPISRIGVIHLTWSRQLQKQLLPHGLTLKQLHVLQELVRNEFLFPSQIARMLFCDRPTASVVIRNLQKNGWIEKERDPENGRRFRIVITAGGRKKVVAVRESGFAGNRGFKITDCLSMEETAQLERLLLKVQSFLQGR